MANDPYTTVPEPDRPSEWLVLERQSSDPGILIIEWDPVGDCLVGDHEFPSWGGNLRVTGPIVQGKRPTRPAP